MSFIPSPPLLSPSLSLQKLTSDWLTFSCFCRVSLDSCFFSSSSLLVATSRSGNGRVVVGRVCVCVCVCVCRVPFVKNRLEHLWWGLGVYCTLPHTHTHTHTHIYHNKWHLSDHEIGSMFWQLSWWCHFHTCTFSGGFEPWKIKYC